MTKDNKAYVTRCELRALCVKKCVRYALYFVYTVVSLVVNYFERRKHNKIRVVIRDARFLSATAATVHSPLP